MKIDEKRAKELQSIYTDGLSEMEILIQNLLSDREELLGALRKYGRHMFGCKTAKYDLSTCTCGAHNNSEFPIHHIRCLVRFYEDHECDCGLSQFLEGERKNV
jgi:hypothetical protein